MAKSPGALERLLNIPDLPAIVPRLQPDILHRVIQVCGLEDSGEILALATPEQLAIVLDSDVWRAPAPGVDEAFDPDRFGLWVSVLVQSGVSVAADKLAGIDIDLVITGLAYHVRVFDYAAVAPYMTLDGDEVPGRTRDDRVSLELGGYLIEDTRTSAWDAIVEVLGFLETERPEFFHRVMRGCVRQSSGPREEDGFHGLLDDRDQDRFDLSCGRETRREERGYVSPAEARAFLHESRDIRLDRDRPARSALARAYFRGIEPPATTVPQEPGDAEANATEPSSDAVSPHQFEGEAIIFEVLEQAGLLTTRPRALLGAGEEPAGALAFIEAHVAAQPASQEELAYLANAILAGCSIQNRPITLREASDCALAVCNLGLENWPSQWRDLDLITAFQVGWNILHRQVCIHAAERLVEILATVRLTDRDTQLQLDWLRRALIRHLGNREPWHAGEALDAILAIDAVSWAALRGFIDQCPVLHSAVGASRQRRRTVSPTDFEFISGNRQIAAVHEFLTALPSQLAD